MWNVKSKAAFEGIKELKYFVLSTVQSFPRFIGVEPLSLGVLIVKNMVLIKITIDSILVNLKNINSIDQFLCETLQFLVNTFQLFHLDRDFVETFSVLVETFGLFFVSVVLTALAINSCLNKSLLKFETVNSSLDSRY